MRWLGPAPSAGWRQIMSLAPSRGDRPELQKPPIATELAGSDIPVAEERAHHAERHD